MSIPTLKLDGTIDIEGTDVSPSGRGPAPAPTTDTRLDWFKRGLKRFSDTIAGKGLGTSRVIAHGDYLDIHEGTAGTLDSTRSLAGSASQPDLWAYTFPDTHHAFRHFLPHVCVCVQPSGGHGRAA